MAEPQGQAAGEDESRRSATREVVDPHAPRARPFAAPPRPGPWHASLAELWPPVRAPPRLHPRIAPSTAALLTTIGTPGPTSPPEVDFRFLGQCWQQPRNSSFRSLIRDRTRCTTAGERNRVTLDAARADYRPACRWRRVAAAPPHDLVRVLSARNLDWSARRSVSAGPSDYLAGLGRRASAPRRRPAPRARSRGAPGTLPNGGLGVTGSNGVVDHSKSMPHVRISATCSVDYMYVNVQPPNRAHGLYLVTRVPSCPKRAGHQLLI